MLSGISSSNRMSMSCRCPSDQCPPMHSSVAHWERLADAQGAMQRGARAHAGAGARIDLPFLRRSTTCRACQPQSWGHERRPWLWGCVWWRMKTDWLAQRPQMRRRPLACADVENSRPPATLLLELWWALQEVPARARESTAPSELSARKLGLGLRPRRWRWRWRRYQRRLRRWTRMPEAAPRTCSRTLVWAPASALRPCSRPALAAGQKRRRRCRTRCRDPQLWCRGPSALPSSAGLWVPQPPTPRAIFRGHTERPPLPMSVRLHRDGCQRRRWDFHRTRKHGRQGPSRERGRACGRRQRDLRQRRAHAASQVDAHAGRCPGCPAGRRPQAPALSHPIRPQVDFGHGRHGLGGRCALGRLRRREAGCAYVCARARRSARALLSVGSI